MQYVLYRIASFMTPTNICKNLFAYTFGSSLSMPESLLLTPLPPSSLFYFLLSASYFPSQADGRGWGQSAPVAMTADSPCLVKARSFLFSISPELSTGKCVCLRVTALSEREKNPRRQQVCASHVNFLKLQNA